MPSPDSVSRRSIQAKVACHCVVEWCRTSDDGDSALSWWHVFVEERPDWRNGPPRRKMYLVKALDDNGAAKQGLRLFEDEFSEPAIQLH
jgi:hypothetical protein